MSQDDRRQSDRLELLGLIEGDVLVIQPTQVRELSYRGMQVETRLPIQVDSLHQFRIILGAHAVVVKGRVAHSRISEVDQDVVTYRSGIEFVEPSEAVETAIRAFIEGVAKARRQD
ncbi:MAG: PilZ domain-containing protein [Acidobacteriota bacterium]